jgi:hypothetical protein
LTVALTLLKVPVAIPLTPSFHLSNENVRVNPSSRLITESFLIRNDSLVDQKIVGADLDAPGIRIVRTNAPLVISTRGRAWVSVTYRVTDCKAAVAAETGAPFPMELRLERWWGVHTVTMKDHGQDYPGPFDICL